MFDAPRSPWLVPFDNSFRIADFPTASSDADRAADKVRLKAAVKQLDDLQQDLYASNRHSVLLVFQAMDAAGKDSTIRAVLKGINPAGCQVFSFKKPTPQELDHDFLWRTTKRLPERGRIGVFNRSQYEEVLIVRVHPGILQYQRLPSPINTETIWDERLQAIGAQEHHLARNGTVILKFWLNVSKEEQKARFLSRIDDPDKRWKFEVGDIKERGYWNDYMAAYEAALNATSRPWAPWYAIPADNKKYMQSVVASILVDALTSLDLHPAAAGASASDLSEIRQALLDEVD